VPDIKSEEKLDTTLDLNERSNEETEIIDQYVLCEKIQKKDNIIWHERWLYLTESNLFYKDENNSTVKGLIKLEKNMKVICVDKK